MHLAFVLQVNFTIDLRAIDDVAREAIMLEFSNRAQQICNHRMVNCTIERKVWPNIHLLFAIKIF